MKRLKKESLVSALQIPKDIGLGAVMMWITGREQICLENYKYILTYTEEEICIQAKHNQVIITGKKLKIDYYTNEMMQISGCIDAVCYQ